MTFGHEMETGDSMTKRSIPFGEKARIAWAIPVLGLLLGGVYSLPAMRLTRDREPWLTILLACGLALTVFGLGSLWEAPARTLMGVYGVSLVLLLGARWLYGSLGHNLERFGMVHMATLLILVGTAAFENARTKADRIRGLPGTATDATPKSSR